MMKFPRVLSILALAGLAFGGPAMAQLKPQASQQSSVQMMRSYQQKTQELKDIQDKTLKSNPKLAAEMKGFEKEMTASMSAHGYDAPKRRKSVQAMIAKLRTGKDASGKDLTQAERESTMKSYQNEVRMMMKARAASMKDPKIQKDRKTLTEHMIAAMTKQDSRTPQLMKDVREMRAKILEIMAAHGQAPNKG